MAATSAFFPAASTVTVTRSRFESEAMPHLNDLKRAARRLTGDEARAEDVVQETFLEAWKSYHRFQQGTNCRAWLFKILMHTIQHHRRQWFRLSFFGATEDVAASIPYTPPVADHLTDEDILAALERLPGDYRAAVLLVDVEEFSYREAAGILSVPIGTVMSRLSRGRRILREQLAGVAEAHGFGKPNRKREES